MDSFYNKTTCAFRIFGLKMERCHKRDEKIQGAVKRIQKSFYGNHKWNYLFSGFNIEDKGKNVKKYSCHIEEDAFNDCLIYNNENQSVSISAIVGKNGTGKSTIIDIIIRVMNNVAAAIIGEDYVYPAAAHLHYIENVYATLAAYIDNAVYLITCKGRELKIVKLVNKNKDGNYEYGEEFIILESEKTDPLKALESQNEYNTLLGKLFYTAVFNYSLYAYNYRDYITEKTPEKRLDTIGLVTKEEDRYWLKGVFWKNDGYQTPIVVNPMRADGMMNISKENKLAKERMLSLLFYEDNKDHFPFRIINNKLKVVGLNLVRQDSPSYNKEYTLRSLEISDEEKLASHYDEKAAMILRLWSEYYSFYPDRVWEEDTATCNYVVYKTIKISQQYLKYCGLYTWLNDEKDNEVFVKGIIEELYHDESHITAKLRRALNFLNLASGDSYFQYGKNNLNSLYNLYDHYQEISLEVDEDGAIKRFLTKDELIPPPSVSMDFDIVPIEKIKADGTYNDKDVIPFEGLSAGERQIAYTTSNIMYHLVNINSVWYDFNLSATEHQKDIRYSYVNLLFDELELYFHPELQRQFVQLVLTSLKCVRLDNIKGVNILMVTHSPFVLSDIPRSNVLALSDDSSIGETFCANIHEMLSQSFFMKYTMGEVSQHAIESFFQEYRTFSSSKDKTEYVSSISDETFRRYKYLKEKVSDEYLRKTISRMYDEICFYKVEKETLESITKKIEHTKRDLEDLQLRKRQLSDD